MPKPSPVSGRWGSSASASSIVATESALLARFGGRLLLRLDQALGLADEKLDPRLPVPERYTDRKFAEPIGLIDDVLMAVDDLSHRLSGQLQGEGAGAQTFHLLMFRVDHEVMHLAVNAARATRDAGHIARLFANRIDKLIADFDAGFGIEMIRLMASSVSELDETHAGSFFGGGDAQALDKLYDRMASRLGAASVLRLKPRDSHIPERAAGLEPLVARTTGQAGSCRARRRAPALAAPAQPGADQGHRRGAGRTARRAWYGGVSATAFSRRRGRSASGSNGGSPAKGR